MSIGKHVAVIGAGLAGLGATKSFREEGFEVTCFEKTGYIGGLWRYHDDDSDGVASVMKSTIINTSKEIGAMSDFPPPAEYPNFMHNSLMYQYIVKSAEKFGGMKYIKFHHEIVKIEKADNYEETGRWKVTCKNTQTGEIVSDVFDCVVIAIGHHVYPNIPSFPGQEEFKGKIIHSHSLKKTAGFEDMRIVVVGTGNSGMDAAVELSSEAKQVYLSSRRGTWVVPKVGPAGQPFDATFIRRTTYLYMKYFPYSLVCAISELFIKYFFFDHKLYNLKPKHRIWSQHPTASDSLPIKLLSGTVVTRGNIKTFTENGVIFEGEEHETPVDAVILCTGYRVQFPFLSEDILSVKDNRVKLYKFIFPPELPHPTLAIIGQIQPNGPGIPAGEMQCRWTSRIMSGKLSLPSKEKMYADIKKKEDYTRRFTDSPRHTFQVEFIEYQDELAEEIGVKPNLLKLAITDPKLFWAVFFGPSLPYQYRLQGPHAWDGARDAILTYNERVKMPLQRPGQKVIKREKGLITFSMIAKVLLILFVVFFFRFCSKLDTRIFF